MAKNKCCKKDKKDKAATRFSTYKHRTLAQRVGDSWLDQDIYAEDIKFNFKGKETMPSAAGAFITMSVKIGIAIFLVTRMLSLLRF
jgi:hypothetical protein